MPFQNFPYSNFHEANQDWILEIIKKIEKIIKDFIGEFDDNLTEKVHDEIGKLIDNGYFESIINDTVICRDLGTLSDLRFAFNPPEDFSVDEFIAQANSDKVIFNQHSWTYSGLSSTTIPLFTDGPYTVTNVNGEVASCSAFVVDCLYKCGYTDLEGKVHYIGAPDEQALEPILEARGWQKVYTIEEIKRGAIVATRWRDYGDYPGHCFIYVSPTEKYDCGSTELIQSGGIDKLEWTTEFSQLDRVKVSGYYHFKSEYPISYGSTVDYLGFVIKYLENIINIFYTQYGWVMRTSEDSGITWGDWKYYDVNISNYTLLSEVKNPLITADNTSSNPKSLQFKNIAFGDRYVKLSGGGFAILNAVGNYLLNIDVGVPPVTGKSTYMVTQVYLSPDNTIEHGVLKNQYRTKLYQDTPTSLKVSQILKNSNIGSYVFIRNYISGVTGTFNLYSSSVESRMDILFFT